MSLITKPMLAATLEVMADLSFPVLASPKLDGIRCLVIKGKILSRTFKDIPNSHIQNVMSGCGLPDGLDGELIVPDKDFNQIQGDVMRESGEPDFRFCVFDYITTSLAEPYCDRMAKLEDIPLPSFCIKVLPKLINNLQELEDYEVECLADGYEGIMVRSVSSPYKCGRATVNQGYLSKIKRFHDSEAIVIGFEEQLHNANEATQDNFGRTKRSKSLEGMEPAGTLGKFLVQEVGNTPWHGQKFGIGTGKGLTQDLRQEIWDNREKYIGKTVTYKYQPHGMLNLPRLPVWKGFRDLRDL